MDRDQYKKLDESTIAAATEWHNRLDSGDASFEDFDRLTVWLEANDNNRFAFDYVQRFSNEIEDISDELLAETDTADADVETGKVVHLKQPNESSRRWSPVHWVSSMAAALTVFALTYSVVDLSAPEAPISAEYVTDQEVLPALALADGSQVDLNVNSRLEVTISAEVRDTRLVEGEATFTVAPDPGRPFFVTVGDTRVRVTGTVFNVAQSPQDLFITVSEGTVEVTASDAKEGEQPLFFETLTAGQQLYRIRGSNAVTVSNVNTNHVLAWRDGQLIYENTPLEKVVSDINRNFGVLISVEDNVRSLSFSGVLFINDLDVILRLLEESLPIRVERLGKTVTIKGRNTVMMQ